MTLRELWERGEPTVGTWLVTPSDLSAELLGRAGFDWICVDGQHGLVGYEGMLTLLQGLAIAGVPAFVRVPSNSPEHIARALDAGAQGVVVPMVSTREAAEQAVTAAKYPPEGTRSWGPSRNVLRVPDYSAAVANRRNVVAVMIETPEGVANMDEIMSVPGVDAIYVGPNDLALGFGREQNDPEQETVVASLLDGCRRHGVVAGIHCDDAQTVARRREAGFHMLNLATDASLLYHGALHELAVARGAEAAPPRRTASYV
ncbi:HpcH/HpaI aldolase/citrate lyase family protein [Spongiactinospora sp. 9N601]|uniref:HpcH/HpaI aldolase/citrate lyase family protein n=1 Tax=Spongiactinospora sp. 9N601 TaxID=3375149 RepID=UPI0037A69DE4